MAHATKYNGFSEQLRREMQRQDVSIKRLGRRWRPDKPEIGRRALQKYLSGAHKPTPETRAHIGASFPEPVSFDDDEEEDEVALLVKALVCRIKTDVRAEVAEQLGAAA
jgi:hypothetical protein